MQTKKLGLVLLLVIALCTFCYYFIDRQLVWWLSAHQSRDLIILKIMANNITTVIGVFICLFYFYFAIKFASPGLGKNGEKLLVMCNAIIITYFLKENLKIVFGRFWPDTFTCNNPSLLKNHVYGFNWFIHSDKFAAFPSGHSAFIFAFSTSMWLLFPALRWVWALLAAMVVTGQACMYFHFVGDIIAGAALGSTVAIYNYRYWQRPVTITN